MSTFHWTLICIGFMGFVALFDALVLNPLTALRALRKLYQLPAERRKGEVLMSLSAQWWQLALAPIYFLGALTLLAIVGGGQ